MAPIPGWAFLGVGAAVAGFSKFVEQRSNSNMTLFFWIGCLFVVIGVAKIGYQMLLEKTRPKTHKNHPHMQQKPMQRQQPLPPMWQGQKRQHGQEPQRTHQPSQQAPWQNTTPTNFNVGTHHVHVPKDEKPADHPGMNNIIACPNCSIKHYSYAKFCMMCGYKIK
jgi:hypothetical protein